MLKLGIATVALVGVVLLMQGSLSVLTFFMFLLVVSRLYDPMQGALQNLAAVISTRTNIARMNEFLDHPIQQGSDRLSNQGYDIVLSLIHILKKQPVHGFRYPGQQRQWLHPE